MFTDFDFHNKSAYNTILYSNGLKIVDDGANFSRNSDASVLAVCQVEGADDMYYYSTTFSGGPGVSI